MPPHAPPPPHPERSVSGKVTHLFGHRFVITTKDGAVLADMTPKGLEQIDLQLDDEVTVEGEMKPSELKVARLTRGKEVIRIEHKKPHPHHHHHHHHHHSHVDPAPALNAAREAGFTVVGTPRRKPKHFEVLGRKQESFSELHIELDGHIRKSKPVAKDDAKWSSELARA